MSGDEDCMARVNDDEDAGHDTAEDTAIAIISDTNYDAVIEYRKDENWSDDRCVGRANQ